MDEVCVIETAVSMLVKYFCSYYLELIFDRVFLILNPFIYHRRMYAVGII